MATLFISYTRADIAKVEVVEDILNRNKIDTWRDKIAMPYAVNWDDAVIEILCRSSFAVIFDSSARQKKLQNPNSAVQREADWIEEIRISSMTIDLEAEENQDMESVANKIINWIKKELNERGDSIKTLKALISGAYAYKYNKVSIEKDSVPRKFLGKLKRIFELSQIKKDLDSTPDFGCGSLKLREPLYGFIKQYRKRLIRLVYLKALFTITLVFVIVFGIRCGIEYYKSNLTYNSIMTLVSERSTISRSIDSDVVLGAALMNSEEIQSLPVLFGNYTRILASKYPTEYFKSDEADTRIRSLNKNTNASYSLKYDSNSGYISVFNDQALCNTFVIDGMPSDYDWSEDEKCVAVSTANKVYLYYLGSIYAPEELKGSYETIERVFIKDKKVYAVTEKHNLVVWDISANLVQNQDYLLTNGRITDKNGGVAVFIYGRKLVVNRNGVITEIDLPTGLHFDDNDLSISHSGQKIALLGTDLQNVCSMIYEYDVTGGGFKQIYSSPNSLTGIDYTYDDSAILFGDWETMNIKKLNLKKGSVSASKKLNSNIYSIKAFNGGCVVCMIDGEMISANNNLALASKVSNSKFGNIAKQIAVSDVNGCYFIASRNANNMGNSRYYLNGKDATILYNIETFETAANSAVAISDDGDYVAFGNNNGSITIRTVGSLLPVSVIKDVKDGIIALSFSENKKTLYVLGVSGTFYTIPLNIQISNCSATDQDAQKAALRGQSREIFDRMSRLGLTDFTLEEFLLQKEYGLK